ncbi:low molecular weight phosphotyrosine protein phosphatase [Cryobacterium sp. TMT1-21]|uniref:protein-tyrosine-phosphatase n=1 Tax=Cryobacterium shii TaxID=1259235 RepID=A0AAQ2C3J6_9MICO|nr:MULTISPECIES: low molecular weight protein-tyrosine-phosphatase [Cryobacterium]TFC41820.1 low molecular weight phosphotyrosine protein phosphatase [Cryobacterium shii]TFC88081.1 low molecular weight phosphotyrosine protein phosphatase [Cryobacterium sp. TmT2-59]TFD08617.1 low molecular weight phosphotyrosine protein phosphatase [Cryobacterium sp. TMT1-21]TFD14818.1 low molecular weight phosphotyrosine protein phosphatase [Cryobacterium sp. TMT4-10]TFD20028.1 low molecular weight phosphotyro
MAFASITPDESTPFRIVFVCTGNICRSPMAEVMLRDLVTRSGLGRLITTSSAGTGDWHVGEQADIRTITALAKRGYDGSHHRARQFDPAWFDDLDLVVVLDRGQERILRNWAATDRDRSKVRLLLSFDPAQAGLRDVPDPYYSDDAFFDTVLGMIESANEALFAQLAPAIRQGVR